MQSLILISMAVYKMKYISVPVSPEAMARLDTDKCVDGDLIDVTISDEQYNLLVKLGLINFININFNINIDEYEDDRIIGIDSLKQLKINIENTFLPDNNEIVKALLTQVNNALKYKTGVFFYF